MWKTVFLLLVSGCSAEFSLAVAVEAGSEEVDAEASSEAAAVDRGSLDAAAPPDAASLADTAPICDPGFPDGGWYCGPSWVNAPDTFICVQHAGQHTTLSAAGNCQNGCVSCATCDLAKACRFFDGGVVGCSDVGGRFVVQCD